MHHTRIEVASIVIVSAFHGELQRRAFAAGCPPARLKSVPAEIYTPRQTTRNLALQYTRKSVLPKVVFLLPWFPSGVAVRELTLP